MAVEIDITGGLASLSDRDLLTHNAAQAVRAIEPGETNAAATLLLWSSFDVEQDVEPPTFSTAISSRFSNISDGLSWIDDIPDRSERRQTWFEALRLIDSLSPTELALSRTAINECLATMERQKPAELSSTEITEIVTNTLFYLYESTSSLNVSDIIKNLGPQSPDDYLTYTGVVSKMFDKQYLMHDKPKSEAFRPRVVFGTTGLWLLESAFTHGEEDIDSMALAERILAQNKFFD